MEAVGLGVFMISAALCTIALYHPASPISDAFPDEFMRRALIGMAMGLTAIGIIYSPWGKQSGAHINPAVTLMFLYLRKIAPWDAFFYMVAQLAGGVLGVAVIALMANELLTHPTVNYVVTIPGPAGIWAACVAEFAISFLLALIVLFCSNRTSLARFTGVFAGLSVAIFITVEAPLSGMSMNPARTIASGLIPGVWNSLWVYLFVPPLAMLLSAAAYTSLGHRVMCAKLHHQNHRRCIFCEYSRQLHPKPSGSLGFEARRA